MKLLASLISSVFTKEEVDSKEVEALKQKGALEDMMGELADYLPSVKSVLIDERDQYLATNIYRSKGKRVLAVVGAGHMAGMIRWISDLAENKVDDDLREISSLPPRKISSRIIPWIIPAFVAGIITYGFIKSGPELGLQMVTTWVLLNGILASIGSIAALAHPLTIIGAFLAAPITSTNPIVGVGMVTGIMEYFLRKPQVRDMESLQDDLTTFKGWYKNRISRILLVFFFSSLGSIVGTFAAIIKNLLLAG
jgi:pheromone shutdown-related protein TraB